MVYLKNLLVIAAATQQLAFGLIAEDPVIDGEEECLQHFTRVSASAECGFLRGSDFTDSDVCKCYNSVDDEVRACARQTSSLATIVANCPPQSAVTPPPTLPPSLVAPTGAPAPSDECVAAFQLVSTTVKECMFFAEDDAFPTDEQICGCYGAVDQTVQDCALLVEGIADTIAENCTTMTTPAPAPTATRPPTVGGSASAPPTTSPPNSTSPPTVAQTSSPPTPSEACEAAFERIASTIPACSIFSSSSPPTDEQLCECYNAADSEAQACGLAVPDIAAVVAGNSCGSSGGGGVSGEGNPDDTASPTPFMPSDQCVYEFERITASVPECAVLAEETASRRRLLAVVGEVVPVEAAPLPFTDAELCACFTASDNKARDCALQTPNIAVVLSASCAAAITPAPTTAPTTATAATEDPEVEVPGGIDDDSESGGSRFSAAVLASALAVLAAGMSAS